MDAQQRKRAFFFLANQEDNEAFGIIDDVRVSVQKARLVASAYNKSGGNTESFFGGTADQVVAKAFKLWGKPFQKDEVFSGIDEPPKLAELADGTKPKVGDKVVFKHDPGPTGFGMRGVIKQIATVPYGQFMKTVYVVKTEKDTYVHSQPSDFIVQNMKEMSSVGAIAGYNGPAGDIPTPRTVKEAFGNGEGAMVDHCQECYGESNQGETGPLKRFKVFKNSDNHDKGKWIDVCEECYNKLKKQGVLRESEAPKYVTCTHCGGSFEIDKVKGLNCPDCGGTFRLKKENLGFGMGVNQIEKGQREKKKTDNMSVYDVMNEVAASPIDGKDKRAAVKWLYNNVVKNTGGFFKDDYWQPINKFFKDVRELGIDIELLDNKYHHNSEGVPNSKSWTFRIQFMTNKNTPGTINGVISAHGAGSIKDPLDRYDITVNMG